MPNYLCQITDAEAGVLTDPAADPDFLNQSYEGPTNRPVPNFSIQIYVGDTGYEFNMHYLAGTAEGEGVFGSRGLASFQIESTHKERFNLPFMPIRFQKVVITDALGEVFTGYIQNIRHTPLKRRADGTYMKWLTIECEDPWSLLEQETYNEFYVAKKAGYILRDAFTKAGFDPQDIDPELGPEFPEYEVIEQYPADVINNVLGYLDYTFWFDRTTLRPQVFARDDTRAELLRIDEDNWHKIFDELEIEEDQTGFANELILEFLQKYAVGTANFEQGSDVVLGYSGDEMWYRLPRNDKLSIQNNVTGAIYGINDNNSDDEETNEIILEANYKEATASGAGTDVSYTIIGGKGKRVARNFTSISSLRAIRGGSGIITRKVVYDNVPMSPEESKAIVKSELAIASRQICIGSARTIAQKLGALLTRSGAQEGRTIYFDLPQSFGVQCPVRIESFRWADNSTRNDRVDGNSLQGFDYETEFTPSVTREQLREISKKLAVSGVTISDQFIEDNDSVASTVAFKDCAHIVEPVKAEDDSIFEAEDTLDYREVDVKTYYFAPAPADEAYFTGFDTFSNFS